MKVSKPIPLLMLLVFTLGVGKIARGQREGPAPVVVSTVLEREVAAAGRFVGSVRPLRKVTIGSAVDGRLESLAVNEGQWVQAQEPLAQLRVKTAEIQLAAANATAELRRQEWLELKNGSRPEDIAQAEARMLAAQAVEKYLQSKFSRAKGLYESGKSISLEELEEASSKVDEATQLVRQLTNAHQLLVQGPRDETIAQTKARLDAAQADVDRLEDVLDKHTVRAPFDGYVTVEHAEVGQWLQQGDAVVDMIDLNPVEVRVFVPEQHVPSLRLGMLATVTLSALPGETLVGEVVRIVPEADARSRTFPVLVELDNPESESGHLLKAGMLARVMLATGSAKQALLVPKDALVLGLDQLTVVVVDTRGASAKQGTTRVVPVEPGVALGGLIQVNGNLKRGEQVIVRGNERIPAFKPTPVLITASVPPENFLPTRSAAAPTVP